VQTPTGKEGQEEELQEHQINGGQAELRLAKNAAKAEAKYNQDKHK
jgi:hypothetical protein